MYVFQDKTSTLDIYTDADYAGDLEERTSTTCVVPRRGRHVIAPHVGTQSVQALSSGEAEFYAMVKGIVIGLFVKNFVKFFEAPPQITILSDSSAARGMISRLGVGRKAKHIDTQFLFAQQLIYDGTIKVKSVPTAENVADIGTKNLPQARMDYLMKLLDMRVVDEE